MTYITIAIGWSSINGRRVVSHFEVEAASPTIRRDKLNATNPNSGTRIVADARHEVCRFLLLDSGCQLRTIIADLNS
ncbi:hypothetical protein SBA2_460027 [Acidobacteriia bacterium SbA2]|nr:hypothetical protein SBA2_460027 [Acidobacteriia bacterium SbA2]